MVQFTVVCITPLEVKQLINFRRVTILFRTTLRCPQVVQTFYILKTLEIRYPLMQVYISVLK